MSDTAFQPDPSRPPQSSGQMDVQVVERVTDLLSRFQTDVFLRLDKSDRSRYDQLHEIQSRMDSRFDVRDQEFDALAGRFDAFAVRVEAHLSPLADLPERVGAVESTVDRLDQQQIALTVRLDAAMDPETEGATLQQRAMQRQLIAMREEMQTGFWRVFWWLAAIGGVGFLILLVVIIVINHYYYLRLVGG